MCKTKKKKVSSIIQFSRCVISQYSVCETCALARNVFMCTLYKYMRLKGSNNLTRKKCHLQSELNHGSPIIN